jgi:hypothetical protein
MTNLERMIALAEEVFHTKNDPGQIAINDETMDRLLRIHPSTMSERKDENGPVAWTIVLPTTFVVMERFVSGSITERELLEETPLSGPYDALYLCSALVLPEARRKGYARSLLEESIRTIARTYPMRSLFSWPFSPEGDALADAVARDMGLPMLKRLV